MNHFLDSNNRRVLRENILANSFKFINKDFSDTCFEIYSKFGKPFRHNNVEYYKPQRIKGEPPVAPIFDTLPPNLANKLEDALEKKEALDRLHHLIDAFLRKMLNSVHDLESFYQLLPNELWKHTGVSDDIYLDENNAAMSKEDIEDFKKDNEDKYVYFKELEIYTRIVSQ